MPKRLLSLVATLIIAFLPFAALADDSTPTGPSATSTDQSTSATTASPSPAADSPSPSPSVTSGLGPSTDANPGASNADGTALQPAGLAPLQSTTQGLGSLTAPTQQALQAPATPDSTLKVLMGEADGATHSGDATDDTSNWSWLWYAVIIVLALGLLAFGVYLLLRRRPKAPNRPSSQSAPESPATPASATPFALPTEPPPTNRSIAPANPENTTRTEPSAPAAQTETTSDPEHTPPPAPTNPPAGSSHHHHKKAHHKHGKHR